MLSNEIFKKYKKFIIVCMVILSCLISGGFFPIINFNLDNPVDIGIMRFIIIVMAAIAYVDIGVIESIIMPKLKILLIIVLNIAIISSGLIFRYLLEFGEISNTYNFTLPNVCFQIFALTAISTVSYIIKKSWHQE